MDRTWIARRRLPNQHLIGKPLGSAIEAVRWFGAVQAQDFAGAKWGLGQRLPAGTTDTQREEALALLAGRYFRSHGPATAHDFAWWSGLTVADAREGVLLCGDALTSRPEGDRTYHFTPPRSSPRAQLRSPTVHLLPNFDEYLVGYRHHEPNYDEKRVGVPRASRGVLGHLLALDGQIVGSWKRTVLRGETRVEARPLVRFGAAEWRAVERSTARYVRFLGTAASSTV